MTGNPFAPPSAVVADVGSAQTLSSQPPFFAVSLLKLVVLSICTFGIYELYWFYKNWQLIKDREGSTLSPALRAVFAVFFCYQCLARIGDFATPALAKSRLAAGPLAVGWILTTLLNRLPGGYGLAALLAVAFLIPVQSRANQINEALSPGHDPNSRFTFWNWVLVVCGLILVPLAVVGTFVTPP